MTNAHLPRRNVGLIGALLCVLTGLPAFAQTPAAEPAPTVVGVVDQPCPSGSFGRTPEELAYAKTVVTDGPMDPAALRAMAKGAPERDKADAWRLKNDWADLCRYREADIADAKAGDVKVVFLGNSITELWKAADPGLFTGGIVDRGISGQSSGQTLVRFYADVVALHPKVVHILVGSNDLAGNNGPSRLEDLKNNIRAMVALAKASHIRVILASITPAGVFPWRPSIHPTGQIREMNAWIAAYAKAEGAIYVDYYTALAGPDGAMKPGISRDGVHPMISGYRLMKPLAQAAIAKAFAN